MLKYGHTTTLLLNEVRMMWNQFKRTLRSPGMLMFYSIMLIGALFISWTVSVLGTIIYLENRLLSVFVELLSVENVLSGLGFMTAAAVVGGYFGLGPAAVLQSADEYILMPAPIWPHQVFLARYVRRVIRKLIFMTLGFFIFFPILDSLNVAFYTFVLFFGVIILYLETNYMLSGVAFYLRKWSNMIKHRPVRYLFLSILPFMITVATLPMFNTNSVSIMLMPSSLNGLLLLNTLHLIALPFFFAIAIVVLLWFIGLYALVASVSTQEYYEAFTSRLTRRINENRVWRIIHGEVDFSKSRFQDPMMWVFLKDFWTRLRLSSQFWKYVSAVIGTVAGSILWITKPGILLDLNINELTVVPSFMILLLLIIQMASLPALLSFIEEKENIYLLKTSPFRRSDIILAKYLGSVIESTIILIPLLLLVSYFFSAYAIEPLLTLAAPLLLIFCATGVVIGAYVPVFTNNPRSPPVPLVFSYPTLNLTIGAAFSALVLVNDGRDILWIIPSFTIVIVSIFLLLAARALKSFK